MITMISKRFDGVLICTDVDGTLICGGKVPERNLDAIREYCERGGKITFCTGRRGRELDNNPWISANAPMIGLTGGELYDFETHSVLERYPMPDRFCDVLRRIAGTVSVKEFQLCPAGKGIVFTPDDLPDSFSEPFYKVVVVTEGFPGALPAEIAACGGELCEINSNGSPCLEITAKGHDKGTGARRVKEFCRAEFLVGIGDAQADLSLLRASDLPIAVGNAISELKAIAKRVVCPCPEGSIADLFESL